MSGFVQIKTIGSLRLHIEYNLVEYKGRQKELDSHYSKCDDCGSEVTTSVQSHVNKRLMVEFKKQVESLLIGDLQEGYLC